MNKERIERLAEAHGLVHPEGADMDDVMDFVRALHELQPMTTAPKDGRELILKVERRAGIRHKYLIGHYQPGGHCIDDHPPIDEGWYFWNGLLFDKAANPIGWLELPHED